MAEAIEGTINVEAHTYEVDAKDSADAILALLRERITLEPMGPWTGWSDEKYAAYKLGHEDCRNTIMAILEGK
jgi:hypothetical protein